MLACIDGKRPPTALLPAAARWARLLHERLVVFTVAKPIPPEIHAGPVRRAYGPDGDVEAYLERAARPLRGEVTDIELHAEYDEFGVAAGLHRHLTTRPTSLVSLGTRLQRGVSRLVFGSPAAEVIRASPSPVLVVPPSGALRR